jgi:hypothetical protein
MPLRVELIARFLEGMFVLGSLGSFVVLVLSGIEDLETLFGMDVKEEKPS